MEKDFKQRYPGIRRIVLIGPESTGKSSLVTALATQYQTSSCKEYSRQYALESETDLTLKDVLPIARGQLALENAAASKAHELLFCDTNPLASALYSKWYYGSVPGELLDFLDTARYDFYLLTVPDLPWEADDIRDMGESREEFFTTVREELKRRNAQFALVSGVGSARLESALKALQEYLGM